jgi:hypothetical protein
MKQWSVQEEIFLTSNLPVMTIKEIAQHLNRSSNSVKHKIERIGAEKPTQRNKWTKEELEILKTNSTLYFKELIPLLPRHTFASIKTKCKNLGLSEKKMVKERMYQGRKFIRNESNKLVPEHRLVLEQYLGKKLTSKEHIHHINCDPLDNSISNLYLCKNFSEHNKIHWSLNSLIKSLMEANLITFDREEGIYKLVK